MIANIDTTALVVVGLFLLVTLVIGLYVGRNIKNFKDYALGGKNFTTATLVLSLLATYIGGGAIIGKVRYTYNLGIITLSSYFLVIQYFIFAFVITPKITQFKNCFTIGDRCKVNNFPNFLFLTFFKIHQKI